MGWIIVVASSEHIKRQDDKLSQLFEPNGVPEISWKVFGTTRCHGSSKSRFFIQRFCAARPVGVENSFYEPQLPHRYWISSNFRWLFHRRFPWGSVAAVDIPTTQKKFSLIVGCTWTPDFINLQNFQLAIRLTVLITGESDNFYGSLFCSRFCFARKFRVNQTERFSNDDVNVAMVIREIELLLLGVHGRMKSRFCCEYQAAAKRNFRLDSCCYFFLLRSSNMCVWETTV